MADWTQWMWDSVSRDASDDELKRKYRTLASRGIDGVFLGGGIDVREFAAVREAGLHLHTWMWTVNRGDAWIRENHPEWYMVSRSGKSCADQPPYVDYYRWLSPFCPEACAYIVDRAAELAAHEAVEGVHLDYVRFPDVILPRGLWEQYGLDQTEELPDYDFDYSPHAARALGRDPLAIEDPSRDQEWIHLRQDAVTRLVTTIGHTVRGHGKSLSAAVFPTPRMARRICRQAWDRWPLDLVCPMLYHSFYLEDVEWIGTSMIENVQAAPFPVVAGLYMPAFKSPEELTRAIELVRRRGGSGVSLFGHVEEEFWEALG